MALNLPLMQNNILKEDLDKVINHLNQTDPKLTQGENVKMFEEEWSKWLGVKFSVFVNSGSSANMLSLAALKHKFPDGGEVIVPPTPSKGKLTATAWIHRENTVEDGKVILDRGRMQGFYQGVPFFSYWLSVAHEKGLKHKQNQGAKGGYSKWFDNEFLKMVEKNALVQQIEQSL